MLLKLGRKVGQGFPASFLNQLLYECFIGRWLFNLGLLTRFFFFQPQSLVSGIVYHLLKRVYKFYRLLGLFLLTSA
jgi:hypothetical protein